MDDKKSLWTKNFILITLLNFLIYWAFQMFPSALPPFVKSIGGENNILGWLNGIATISTLLVRPFAGRLADKYGRKGVFITGLIIMILAITTYKIFPVVWIIIAFRFLHGAGWAFASTASNTIATDNIGKEKFGEGMGYFSLSVSLALAIAPAISLAIDFTWVIVLAIILNVITLISLSNIEYKKMEPTIVEPNKNLFEKNALKPSIIMFFITTTYGTIITFLALYGAERNINNIGILFFPVLAISMLISRPILGKLIDKYGFNLIIYPSLFTLAIGLVILSFSNSVIIFLLSGVIYGVSYGALQTALQTLALIKTPQDKIGMANATFFMWFDGGIGFGSVIAGVLAGSLGFGGMYRVMGLLPILALIIFFFMNKKSASKK